MFGFKDSKKVVTERKLDDETQLSEMFRSLKVENVKID